MMMMMMVMMMMMMMMMMMIMMMMMTMAMTMTITMTMAMAMMMCMTITMCIFLTVSQDTLLDMVACCTSSEKVGLVHQLPFVCDRKGFAAVLEKVSCSPFYYNII